jgi:hypothetical protein
MLENTNPPRIRTPISMVNGILYFMSHPCNKMVPLQHVDDNGTKLFPLYMDSGTFPDEFLDWEADIFHPYLQIRLK